MDRTGVGNTIKGVGNRKSHGSKGNGKRGSTKGRNAIWEHCERKDAGGRRGIGEKGVGGGRGEGLWEHLEHTEHWEQAGAVQRQMERGRQPGTTCKRPGRHTTPRADRAALALTLASHALRQSIGWSTTPRNACSPSLRERAEEGDPKTARSGRIDSGWSGESVWGYAAAAVANDVWGRRAMLGWAKLGWERILCWNVAGYELEWVPDEAGARGLSAGYWDYDTCILRSRVCAGVVAFGSMAREVCHASSSSRIGTLRIKRVRLW